MKNKSDKLVGLDKLYSRMAIFKNNKSFLRAMYYKEDPLLQSQIKFLDHNLNLYGCLLRKEDLEKDSIFRSVPYAGGRIFYELKDKIDSHLLDELQYYLGRKIIRKLVKNWLRVHLIPFPLLRVFSLRSENPTRTLADYFEKTDFITNCQSRKHLKFPKVKEELLDNDAAYLYGCFLADGCISGQLLKINDGHPNPAELECSRQHIINLAGLFKGLYGVDFNIRRINNQYQLETVSKFLSRFLKFFYGFSKDHGRYVKKPEILNGFDQQLKSFYRGYFDADGSVKKEDKYICLKSVYAPFLEECKKDFQHWGINTSPVIKDKQGISQLRILSIEMKNFSEHIGFRHPRKQLYLINHLKRGCALREFKGLKEKSLCYQFYDLSKINDLRVEGMADIFKEWRKVLGTQENIAQKLGTFRGNVKRWENGNASIPFKYFLKVAEMNGFQKVDVFKLFEFRNLVTFSKGTLKQMVKLPLTFQKEDERLFSYLVPDKNEVHVKIYGVGYNKEDNLIYKTSRKFGKQVVKNGSIYSLTSNLLSEFLLTFFKYEVAWKPMGEDQIKELQKIWNNG